MIYSPEDVNSWPYFKPLIIAHDVGRSRDHSTAVVGGNSPCGRRLVGIRKLSNCRKACSDTRVQVHWLRSIGAITTTH